MEDIFLPNFEEKTGLTTDYKNSLNGILYRSELFYGGEMPRQEYFDSVSKPIETYETRYRRTFPSHADLILSKAQPEALKKLNDAVENYNSLTLEGRAKRETIVKFYDAVEKIINGTDE